ncbi:MAG: hypothetical protein C0413_05415 [Clostridiales bacterium]|nr:hypothetical protein [Clostridiales bacterium]
MDFVSEQLYNGKRFRTLKVRDTLSKDSSEVNVEKSIKNEQDCEEMGQFDRQRFVAGKGNPHDRASGRAAIFNK